MTFSVTSDNKDVEIVVDSANQKIYADYTLRNNQSKTLMCHMKYTEGAQSESVTFKFLREFQSGWGYEAELKDGELIEHAPFISASANLIVPIPHSKTERFSRMEIIPSNFGGNGALVVDFYEDEYVYTEGLPENQ